MYADGRGSRRHLVAYAYNTYTSIRYLSSRRLDQNAQLLRNDLAIHSEIILEGNHLNKYLLDFKESSALNLWHSFTESCKH